ncbi:hypothetical protein SAMN05216206_2808 [Pseudomonas guineae]|uniref:Uncharacterized protein n=1 Tax=Pseudomonas guineae TaxID=425504 RepID=A0A1I3KG88_9PSED|nr:hypothetical protein SAMN05216206_2808 [Pseudomonas guineae]
MRTTTPRIPCLMLREGGGKSLARNASNKFLSSVNRRRHMLRTDPPVECIAKQAALDLAHQRI